MEIKSVCVCTCWDIEWNPCITFPGWLVMKELEVYCLYSERSEFDFLFFDCSSLMHQFESNEMKWNALYLKVLGYRSVRRKQWDGFRSEHHLLHLQRLGHPERRGLPELLPGLKNPSSVVFMWCESFHSSLYLNNEMFYCGCRSFIQSSSILRCFSLLDLSRGGQQIIKTFCFKKN